MRNEYTLIFTPLSCLGLPLWDHLQNGPMFVNLLTAINKLSAAKSFSIEFKTKKTP